MATKPGPAPPRDARHGDYLWGTGRRKSSVARVRIKPGEGKYVINKREPDNYFTQEKDRNLIVAPLKSTGALGKVDVIVTVHGGGCTGQAGAIALGLGRALKAMDPTYESALRANGFLTRDPRMKERKKPGQRGARRKFQFSKR